MSQVLNSHMWLLPIILGNTNTVLLEGLHQEFPSHFHLSYATLTNSALSGQEKKKVIKYIL